VVSEGCAIGRTFKGAKNSHYVDSGGRMGPIFFWGGERLREVRGGRS